MNPDFEARMARLRELAKTRRGMSSQARRAKAAADARSELKKFEAAVESERAENAMLLSLMLSVVPVTDGEVARALNVHRSTTSRWAADPSSGYPEGFQVGRTTYRSGVEICRWLAAKRGLPVEEIVPSFPEIAAELLEHLQRDELLEGNDCTSGPGSDCTPGQIDLADDDLPDDGIDSVS
jgi:hypothetical protein